MRLKSGTYMLTFRTFGSVDNFIYNDILFFLCVVWRKIKMKKMRKNRNKRYKRKNNKQKKNRSYSRTLQMPNGTYFIFWCIELNGKYKYIQKPDFLLVRARWKVIWTYGNMNKIFGQQYIYAQLLTTSLQNAKPIQSKANWFEKAHTLYSIDYTSNRKVFRATQLSILTFMMKKKYKSSVASMYSLLLHIDVVVDVAWNVFILFFCAQSTFYLWRFLIVLVFAFVLWPAKSIAFVFLKYLYTIITLLECLCMPLNWLCVFECVLIAYVGERFVYDINAKCFHSSHVLCFHFVLLSMSCVRWMGKLYCWR